MDRLLSGDVGLDKTEVTMNAMLLFFRWFSNNFCMSNYTSATQHYHSMQKIFPLWINIAKLDGKTSAKKKNSY